MAALDRGLAELVSGCAVRAGGAGLGLGVGGVSARGRAGPGAARWGAPPAPAPPPRSPGPAGAGLAAAAAPSAALDASRAPAGGGHPRASLFCRRKHRMDAEPEGCPASKKRPAEAELCPPTPALEQWMLCAGQTPHQCPSGLPRAPGPLEIPCEEMEQAAGEQQCEAARRKLQEIEARITDEDEDEDGLVEAPLSNLPTLVLSDTLKTGLKRDYTGDLTKKIVESMSRPSMELVVWKPLPEFLTKKAKAVSVKNYKLTAERCPAKPATLGAAFCLQTGKFSELQPTEMPSAFYSAVEPPTGCSEEEMEL
uniref:coiled-coil domain-containing protein 117 n=1 Tax=Euleptes europaea TaxID=460621 RepID=UPI00253FD7FF|nr:coiled-coil domain-containing protein 117 [Euleptes europaea]